MAGKKRINYFAVELKEAFDNLADKEYLLKELSNYGWIDEDCDDDSILYEAFIHYILRCVEFDAAEVGVSVGCEDNITAQQLVKEGK